LAEIWAIARYDFGLQEEEVGKLNLREYDALSKRKQAERNDARLNAGIIAAAILNSAAFGDPDRKPVTALDFVPDLKAKVEGSAPRVDMRNWSPEDQRQHFMSIFGKRLKRKQNG
jgi:hypothetical protein